MSHHPPKLLLRFFRWYCHPKMQDYIEGDLMEVYERRLKESGKQKADLRFMIDVLLLFRPGIIRPVYGHKNVNTYGMYKSYFKIGWRNLVRNKGYSVINIGGLAMGMTVSILIGLWIKDELTYNQCHKNYDRIAQVWQHNTHNGVKSSGVANPYLLAEEIRNSFGSDFKYALQSTWTLNRILAVDDKLFNKLGMYWEPQVIDMLSLRLVRGTNQALKDPYSILLSESVARAFFGDTNPIGQTMRINNNLDVKITGVYEDLPHNSSFRDMSWIMPWELFVKESDYIKYMTDPWDNDFTQTWVQVADHADMDLVSAKIVNVKYNKSSELENKSRPEVFLHPMSKWHLYSEFRNGQNTGGRIEFVWLFGIIGIFVLLVACINFMNLSTARSEKRAKEVGIRKSLGSVRAQLISQFFSESLLIALVSFAVSLALVRLMLPYFNQVAGKNLTVLWQNPLFWAAGIGFSIFTGILAGSYPAIYLSSFRPVKVLKGTFRAGKNASLPRRVLVVLQSAVSVTLIICTFIVFKQIDFAMNRPIGYDRNGLVNIPQITDDIHKHFDAFRNELIGSGTILEAAESGSPLTQVWNSDNGFTWQGKDPSLSVNFPNNGVTYEYGKTVGWTVKEGRDFSRDYSDGAAFVINEAAAGILGFDSPVGQELRWNDKPYTIIGVINDMIIESPYAPVRPQLFHIDLNRNNMIILKLNPERGLPESLQKVQEVFMKYNQSSPFEFQLVEEDYERKFESEVRIGQLASFFTILAVLIGSLGIFGLASFTAEQRIKEIGVRKVLGASVLNLWGMLSKDFVMLVIISCLIAIPIGYVLMHEWLQKYEYRTEISWWIFALAVVGTLLITLFTVSYQSIKAALANPVKSLKSE